MSLLNLNDDSQVSIEEEKEPTFWTHPATFFFTGKGKTSAGIGGVIVGLLIIYLFGLIGVGIYLALFYLIRGVFKKS